MVKTGHYDKVQKQIEAVLDGYDEASGTETVFESKKSRLGKEILQRILDEN